MQAFFIVLLIFFSANLFAKEPINLKAIFLIKQEALEKSQVMEKIKLQLRARGAIIKGLSLSSARSSFSKLF